MIEKIGPKTGQSAAAPGARVAVFDFDGTLSLIRTGWVDVMVPMMVEGLLELNSGESEQQLTQVVRDYVWRLTGKETIYQMMAYAEEVEKRGGKPKEALEYKHEYLDRLWQKISGRVEELESGKAQPADYLVPGVRDLLEGLAARGLTMYLASGTDEVFVKKEAELLDVAKYFKGGVYGARDDYKSFSKKILVQRIISDSDVQGADILGFGDGYVEIEEVKLVGGTAVGIASTEPECVEIDNWKRERLIKVGADYIVPNFLEHQQLLALLFGASAAAS